MHLRDVGDSGATGLHFASKSSAKENARTVVSESACGHVKKIQMDQDFDLVKYAAPAHSELCLAVFA